MSDEEEILDSDVDSCLNTESPKGTEEKNVKGGSSGSFLRIRGPISSCCTNVATALRGWVKDELVSLFKLAFPIILMLVFQQCTLTVSVAFVGHISGKALELDASALSISFVNITGVAVGIGLASAADTLSSQAYGFKNYIRVGHIFQRGVLILCVLSLFTLCVWLNTESILLLFQQPPCVSRLSGYFIQIFCFALMPLFLYIMLQKYLNTQGIVWLFVLVGLIVNLLNPVFHAIFIFGAGLGVNGAAISLVLVNICQPLLTIVFVRIRKLHKKTWGGWSMVAFRGWWEFLRLGLPGVAMICIEWVSFEIATFVVGTIDEVQLAINTVIIAILTIIFMLPLGLSIAGTVRVGNELGAGQPQKAKRAAYVCITVACINALASVVLVQCVKNVIGKLFTAEEAVLDQLPGVLNLASCVVFTDQVQISISGVLRGCGRQLLGAVVNFVAFYVIGLPIGISLALAAEMGTLGMWIGLVCASATQAVVFTVVVLLTNWKKEAMKASEQASGEAVKEKEVADVSSLHSSDSGQELVSSESSFLHGAEEDKENMEDGAVKESQVANGSVELDSGTVGSLTVISLNSVEDERMNSEEDNLVGYGGQDLKMHSKRSSLSRKSNLKLLLSKGSVFVVGAMLVVAAGVASQYHPPDNIINGNFSECTTSNGTAELFSSSHIQNTITPTNAFSMSTGGHITTNYIHTYLTFPLTPTP